MRVIGVLNITAFYVAALLVLASAFIFALLRHRFDRPQNKLYLFAVGTMIVQSICCIGIILERVDGEGLRFRYEIMDVCNFLYFLLHTVMVLLLLYYALFATRTFRRYSLLRHTILLIPFLAELVLILLNPLRHDVYTLHADLTFTRGWGDYVIYLLSGLYLVFAVWLFVFRWYTTTARRKRILGYSLFVGVCGVFLQLLFPQAEVELFAESITFLGILLSVEYDEELLDATTGVYNRTALFYDLRSYFELKMPFYVIAVQFRNLEILKRLTGASNNELLQELSASLKAVHPQYLIYRATPSSFLLLSPTNERKAAEALADAVQKRLQEDWEEKAHEVSLRATVLYAAVPQELSSTDDILLLCESTVEESDGTAPLSGPDLKAIFDQAALAEALHRGITDHNFEVVYQPVYGMNRRRIEAAESLLRLHDPVLGNILPTEFIPLAERNGLIRQLGEYALREVCSFLQSGVPEKLGIRFIGVNLSIVQCTNPEFVRNASKIVEEFSVDPSFICFEIAETAAESDYGLLNETIKSLKARGFRFSMDGYGAGSANMYAIFGMDFDMVKLDKSLLYAAEESKEGQIVLESSVRLVSELNRRVVVIGVETGQQLSLVKNLPVNWVQGNYFAGTLSRSELIEQGTSSMVFG